MPRARPQRQASAAKRVQRAKISFSPETLISGAKGGLDGISSNGLPGRIECNTALAYPKSDRDFLWSLLERNMKQSYQATPDGWDEEGKYEELFHEESWILLVREEKGQCPVAFVSFRLDTESTMGPHPAAVVYCYEVQVDSAFRGQGIASHLLHLTQTIAASLDLDKVMLTVFSDNEKAIRLYHHLGFQEDEISPGQCLSPSEAQAYHYTIMSWPCPA